MITLISPAKTMREEVASSALKLTTPVFEDRAALLAHELRQWSAEDWEKELKLSSALATEVAKAYAGFDVAEKHPAVMAYDGIVFKYLKPLELKPKQLSNLRICSFLYGYLRASDAIVPYRLEGDIKLEATNGGSLFNYWKPIMTEQLTRDLENDPDHTLLFLGSEEMKKLFDWRQISKQFSIIQPLFLQHHGGRLRQIVVHSKMCRGTMAHHALKEGWHGTPKELKKYADSEEMELQPTQKSGVYHLIIG